MTAQRSDIYRYKNEEYSIIALSTPITFAPEDYGLKPEGIVTSCWRGYWCEYDIESDFLLLKNLYIHNQDNQYPPLNGVSVSPPEYVKAKAHTSKGKKNGYDGKILWSSCL